MSSDDDDNLYPISSAFLPTVPKELKEERDREKAEMESDQPFYEELLKHLNDRIKFRDSIDSIDVDPVGAPADFHKAFVVNKAIKAALVEERAQLEDRIGQFKKMR